MDPKTYLDEIRAEVPRYDQLQEATIEAIPFAPGSVLDLDAEQKRDLFRRVREQSRAMVMGDVVVAEPQVTPLEEGVDLPSRAEDMAEWCSGEIVWRADDLAVIRSVYA
jgi:hypothetical protein